MTSSAPSGLQSGWDMNVSGLVSRWISPPPTGTVATTDATTSPVLVGFVVQNLERNHVSCSPGDHVVDRHCSPAVGVVSSASRRRDPDARSMTATELVIVATWVAHDRQLCPMGDHPGWNNPTGHVAPAA